MTTIMLRTRDEADGRIFVSDGKGTSGSYPRDYHDQGEAHRHAARWFLAELKGWSDATVTTDAELNDGYILTATRRAVAPSRRRRPVEAVERVCAFLERANLDVIHSYGAHDGSVYQLRTEDLRALLDYIREA